MEEIRKTSWYKNNIWLRIAKTFGYVFGLFGLLMLFLTINPFNLKVFIIYFVILAIGVGLVLLHYLGKERVLESIPTEDMLYHSKVELELTKFDERYGGVVTKVISYVFLTVCAILAFLPFYWMIMTSVKNEADYRTTQGLASFWPKQFQFANYKVVVSTSEGLTSNKGFLQMLINTLVVGITSTVLGVIICIITAYGLARMDFKGKNLLFTLMLGTMMIPGELFTLTNYLTTVATFKWYNTFTIMIVPFLVSIYYIYLLRNNFMQIPNSLYQAAKVDGLSDMGYLIKVMVPLTAPTLISVTLLKFIGTWNSYIWPKLVNNESWRMITNWVTNGFLDYDHILPPPAYANSYTTLKMAAVCMVSLPLFILFTCFRKYIMKGVSKSGTKG